MKPEEISESEYLQMKAELDSLKQMVSENIKLNEQAIRRLMQNKADELTRFAVRLSLLALAAMFLIPFAFYHFYHVSVAFIIATELMMTVCILATAAIHAPVYRLDFANGSLVEAANKVNRFKRLYMRWPYLGIPMVILWIVWLLYEIYSGTSYNREQVLILGASILCGAIIGGAIGIYNNRRMVRKADEILDENRHLKP